MAAEPPVAEPAGIMPADALVTCVTSGSTAAPGGRTRLIRPTSEATLEGDALITMALAAGTPSDLAVESDTTASTPLMPTVPNATTGSRSGRRPAAVTSRPRESRSRVPMV